MHTPVFVCIQCERGSYYLDATKIVRVCSAAPTSAWRSVIELSTGDDDAKVYSVWKPSTVMKHVKAALLSTQAVRYVEPVLNT